MVVEIIVGIELKIVKIRQDEVGFWMGKLKCEESLRVVCYYVSVYRETVKVRIIGIVVITVLCVVPQVVLQFPSPLFQGAVPAFLNPSLC